MNKMNHPVWGLLVSTAFIILLLEISPYILGKVILGNPFSRKELKKELQVAPGDFFYNTDKDSLNGHQGQYLGDHLLHPYMGFVGVPRTGYNRFGFPGDEPILKRSNDQVNICLTGGSVAMQLFRFSKERITEYLALDPSLAGKKINISLMALGGFKQPQQLISLNYLMALGAQYDVVVNLDGFNEVVLPYSDNLPFGVYPSYPRHWNIYSRKSLKQEVIFHMGKQFDVRERRESTRKKLAHSLLRHSNFMLFLWKLSDINKNNQFLVAESALRGALEQSDSDFQSTGPSETVTDTLKFFSDQVALWANASAQMAALGEGMGFHYLHFLQPNQYDEGSRQLTPEEMVQAFESGPFAYKDAVIAGYPLLRKAGEGLIQTGVYFVDLTGMFTDEKRTVYADKCCHFNQLGNDLLADSIAFHIVRKMRGS
ncbi:MAG: hypothetical protein ACNA7V_04870 [Bacteroidales bacterium]